jgi:serine/threonine protein phosphatase 1
LKGMILDSYKEILELPRHLYVIGDIHGCFDELVKLVEFLKIDQGLSAEDMVVFLGDYIDRGMQSHEVVEYLLMLQKEFPQVFFLKGNHEDMFLNFLGFEGHLGEGFLQNGGINTLISYSLSALDQPDEIFEQLPDDHIDFLQNLDRYIIVGDYVIAHAGLNPLRDLTNQVDEDLFWIRDEFISNIHYFDKTVIFGHTPHQDVVFHLPYKIGIDTGLVYGHKLTCLELIKKKIFQIRHKHKKVKVSNFKDRTTAKEIRDL